jgi:hypothetical protein
MQARSWTRQGRGTDAALFAPFVNSLARTRNAHQNACARAHPRSRARKAFRARMQELHDHSIVVQDLKCDNFLLDKYETIFVDSITVASRLCLQWSKGQPQAMSDRSGKTDMRGAYGLHGREMIAWLTHLQHTRAKNVWFVGILDEKLDDFNRKVFALQIDGSKTGLELPGIVDEVITLAEFQSIVAQGWVRPDDGYHTIAVAEDFGNCPGDGYSHVGIPGWGEFNLFQCGEDANYCNRAIACVTR